MELSLIPLDNGPNFGLSSLRQGPATTTSPPENTQQWACQYRHPLEQSPTESGLIFQLLHHFTLSMFLCGSKLRLVFKKSMQRNKKLALVHNYQYDLKWQPRGGGTQKDFYERMTVDFIPLTALVYESE